MDHEERIAELIRNREATIAMIRRCALHQRDLPPPLPSELGIDPATEPYRPMAPPPQDILPPSDRGIPGAYPLE